MFRLKNRAAVMNKAHVQKLPLIGPALTQINRAVLRRAFPGSAAYWERRYRQGDNSGDGSYGPVAQYKASILNDLVSRERLQTVVEFGCGDGNQLSLTPYPSYMGFDVSATAIGLCSERFANDKSKSFLWYDPYRFVNNGAIKADLAISLDVLFHLVERQVFERHLAQLFDAATRYVVIFAADIDRPDISAHVRHRTFSGWISTNRPEWTLERVIANPTIGQDTVAQFHVYGRRSPTAAT
jgi:SAM-dependent methyltransferase